MGYVGCKIRSLGQIIEESMIVTKGLGFKSLLFNAKPHKWKAQVSESRAIMVLSYLQVILS